MLLFSKVVCLSLFTYAHTYVRVSMPYLCKLIYSYRPVPVWGLLARQKWSNRPKVLERERENWKILLCKHESFYIEWVWARERAQRICTYLPYCLWWYSSCSTHCKWLLLLLLLSYTCWSASRETCQPIQYACLSNVCLSVCLSAWSIQSKLLEDRLADYFSRIACFFSQSCFCLLHLILFQKCLFSSAS